MMTEMVETGLLALSTHPYQCSNVSQSFQQKHNCYIRLKMKERISEMSWNVSIRYWSFCCGSQLWQAGYRILWYKTTTTKRPIHDRGVMPPSYLRDVRVKILISLMHHGNNFWSVHRLLGLRSKHRHTQAGKKTGGIAHNVDWRCREVFSSLLARQLIFAGIARYPSPR